MTTSAELSLAGSTFGTAMWLRRFLCCRATRRLDVVFTGRAGHHIIAFLGYAFFFGAPLGWLCGRVGALRPLTR